MALLGPENAKQNNGTYDARLTQGVQSGWC